MKSAEVREMQDQELAAHIKTVRRDIFGLRFQHATGELENTSGMRAAKKALARALTIARERGLDTNKL
jgi:large subunit ribosomal protein L29